MSEQTERKLATIRKIDKISPIEGADRIEKVTIGGWNIVSQKDLYKEGDLVIYCEIDSFIPTEIAPFLTQEGQNPKEYNGVKGERLRTKKLRGVVSQGLLLPVDIHVDINIKQKNNLDNPYVIVEALKFGILSEGDDVTEILGIQKYEAPIPACLSGVVRGNFPSFIRKTDEERIQNLSDEFEGLKKETYIITEKLDGTSTTFYYNEGVFGVCSRNLDLKDTEGNTLWDIAKRHNVEEKLTKMGKNIAIQGETIGSGIQCNPYKLKGQDIYVFNGFDIDKQEFLPIDELHLLCKNLGLEQVPVITSVGDISDMSMKDIILMADGKSQLHKDTNREGIVFKTIKREKSFKAISNTFLIKSES